MADTCPHCGHETEAEVCPLCGSKVAGAGEPAREAPAGAAGREGGPVAWEDPSVPFPENLWRSWRKSVFAPTGFYRRVGGGGSMARPILYYLLLSVTGAVLALVWRTVWLSGPSASSYLDGGAGVLTSPAVSFFLAPFLALAGLVVSTVLYHLAAVVLAPDRRGMAETARVICYAAGPSVFAVVPVAGSLVAAVWTLALQVVGLREVHRTSTVRAVLMVFWIWIVVFVLGALAVVLAVGAGLGSMAGDGLLGALASAGLA